MNNSVRHRTATRPLTASFAFVTSLSMLLALLFLSGCGESTPEYQDFDGQVMGTTWHVRIRPSGAKLPADIGQEIQATLDRVDWIMSTYKEESELSKLNREPVGQPIEISSELQEILQLAKEISERSEGAFDLTVGPLVNLWGFGPDLVVAPETDQIESTMAMVGMNLFTLNQRSLTKHADIYIDLSAIAKGYAVDRVANYLQEQGIQNYLVEVGGELRFSLVTDAADADSSTPWRVAVEDPVAELRQVYKILNVETGAMATSGNYRNFVLIDGQKYSHTIDPTTGWPVSNELVSATVILPTAAEADALATAFLVLGTERSLALAEQHKIPLLMLVEGETELQEVYSTHFQPWLQ